MNVLTAGGGNRRFGGSGRGSSYYRMHVRRAATCAETPSTIHPTHLRCPESVNPRAGHQAGRSGRRRGIPGTRRNEHSCALRRRLAGAPAACPWCSGGPPTVLRRRAHGAPAARPWCSGHRRDIRKRETDGRTCGHTFPAAIPRPAIIGVYNVEKFGVGESVIRQIAGHRCGRAAGRRGRGSGDLGNHGRRSVMNGQRDRFPEGNGRGIGGRGMATSRAARDLRHGELNVEKISTFSDGLIGYCMLSGDLYAGYASVRGSTGGHPD